jgi:hypothetical protein
MHVKYIIQLSFEQNLISTKLIHFFSWIEQMIIVGSVQQQKAQIREEDARPSKRVSTKI